MHRFVETGLQEWLYREEFEGYEAEGVLQMHTAFSREQVGMVTEKGLRCPNLRSFGQRFSLSRASTFERSEIFREIWPPGYLAANLGVFPGSQDLRAA